MMQPLGVISDTFESQDSRYPFGTSMYGNPLYNTVPAADGLAGLWSSIGRPIVAGMLGMNAIPFVDPGQSMASGLYASGYMKQQYDAFNSRISGQFGRMLGSTVGGIVHNIDGGSGASREEDRKALADKYAGFGVGYGAMAYGMLDPMLSSIGLTGGSVMASSNMAFRNRMLLGMPGAYSNPYDEASQGKMVANAAAFTGILNDFITPGLDGIMPNLDNTKGIGREAIFKAGLRMAGSGAFNDSGKSLGEQLQDIASDESLKDDYDNDLNRVMDAYDGGKLDDGKFAATKSKIKEIRDRVKEGVGAAVDTLGAMRDLLGDIGDDKLISALDNLTGGAWTGSVDSAKAAKRQVRELTAVSSMYGLDPTKAVQLAATSQALMQDAAGFSPDLVAAGFGNGGMFGIGAQTDLLESSEQLISARGVRGDAVKSNRIRMQGMQAMARAMNTQAGAVAQSLAYARQTGVVDDDEYNKLSEELSSGDESKRNSAFRSVLRKVYGSESRGMRMINDRSHMMAVRDAMDERAGRDAMSVMRRGMGNEWMRKEVSQANSSRYAAARDLLSESGMSKPVGEGDVGRIISGLGEISPELKSAFEEQYKLRRSRGDSSASAFSATLSSIKSSAQFESLGGRIDDAVAKTRGDIASEALKNGGREAYTARGLLDFMSSSGISVDGDKISKVRELISSGKANEALSVVDEIAGGQSDAMKKMISNERKALEGKFDDEMASVETSRKVADRMSGIVERNYGSEAAAAAQNKAIALAKEFQASDRGEEAAAAFRKKLMSSGVGAVLGEEVVNRFSKFADMGSEDQKAFLREEGRISSAMAINGTEVLGGLGWGYGQTGFFSGGGSLARGKEADEAKKAIMAKFDEADTKGGTLRKNFAMRLLDMAEGKGGVANVLGIYSDEDVMKVLGNGEKDKFEANRKKIKESNEDFKEREKKVSEFVEQTAADKDMATAVDVSSAVDKIKRGEDFSDDALASLKEKVKKSLRSRGKSGDDADEVVKGLKAMRDSRSAASAAASENVGIVAAAMGDPEKRKKLEKMAKEEERLRNKFKNTDSIRNYVRDLDVEEGSEAQWNDVEEALGKDAVKKYIGDHETGDGESADKVYADKQRRREAMQRMVEERDSFAGEGQSAYGKLKNAAKSAEDAKNQVSVKMPDRLTVSGTVTVVSGREKADGTMQMTAAFDS